MAWPAGVSPPVKSHVIFPLGRADMVTCFIRLSGVVDWDEYTAVDLRSSCRSYRKQRVLCSQNNSHFDGAAI